MRIKKARDYEKDLEKTFSQKLHDLQISHEALSVRVAILELQIKRLKGETEDAAEIKSSAESLRNGFSGEGGENLSKLSEGCEQEDLPEQNANEGLKRLCIDENKEITKEEKEG